MNKKELLGTLLKERLESEVGRPEFISTTKGKVEFGTQNWHKVIEVIEGFAKELFAEYKEEVSSFKTRLQFLNFCSSTAKNKLFSKELKEALVDVLDIDYNDYSAINVENIHTALTNELIIAAY